MGFLRLMNQSAAAVLLATAISTPTLGVDRMLGLEPTDGHAMLVKMFIVQPGVVITGVQFSSNDPRTSFPEVSLFEGPLDRLSQGRLIASSRDVQSASSTVTVGWVPVTAASNAPLYVAIRLPEGPGRLSPGVGAGLGANDVAIPRGSFLAGNGEEVLLPVRADLDVNLLTTSTGAAAPGGPNKAGDARPEQASMRTFLSAPSISTRGTNIEYGVSESGDVEIGIYDVVGRLVRQIVSEPVSEGTHRVNWDGRDERSLDVPSGLYFVRLTTPNATLSRKLLVIR